MTAQFSKKVLNVRKCDTISILFSIINKCKSERIDSHPESSSGSEVVVAAVVVDEVVVVVLVVVVAFVFRSVTVVGGIVGLN